MTVALAIVLFCIKTNNDIHIFVVALAPIELLIAFGKICDILRRNELQSRKQKVLKVLSSSQVLDALSICLASLIFFSVRYISSFKYTFCLGPIVLASLITILKTLFTNREVDSADKE